MSIVESLKRLVDPVQARKEEAERRRGREQRPRETEGPPAFRCRVCGGLGRDAMFCADCLAATMEPVGKR